MHRIEHLCCSKTVLLYFYTSDLTEKQPLRIHFPEELAVLYTHGLASPHIWIRPEYIRRRTSQSPGVILTYNHFINAVCKLNLLPTSPSDKKRDKSTCTHTDLYSWAIGLNAHAILLGLEKPWFKTCWKSMVMIPADVQSISLGPRRSSSIVLSVPPVCWELSMFNGSMHGFFFGRGT